MAEGDRPAFLPPTAEPPRYGEGAPPSPPPRYASQRASAPAPAAPPPAGPGRNYSVADPGPPGSAAVAPAQAEPSNPLAVWSIVLGTIGLLLLLTFLGVVFVNLPCSILAWVLGAKAKEHPGQASMAQAGKVTGIVGTVLGGLATLFWLALFVASV